MSHIPIESYTPKDPAFNMEDAIASGPRGVEPILINSLGRFYTDKYNFNYVGAIGVLTYPAASFGARMVILLHELAHTVLPPGFISDDTSKSGDSEKNTETLIEHCKDAIKAAVKSQP